MRFGFAEGAAVVEGGTGRVRAAKKLNVPVFVQGLRVKVRTKGEAI